MDFDIICKFLKINKGGVGGVPLGQGSGVRDQEKPGAAVNVHALIVRLWKVIFCNGRGNKMHRPAFPDRSSRIRGVLAQKKGGTSVLAARAGRPVTQTTSSFGGGISASSSTGIYTP